MMALFPSFSKCTLTYQFYVPFPMCHLGCLKWCGDLLAAVCERSLLKSARSQPFTCISNNLANRCGFGWFSTDLFFGLVWFLAFLMLEKDGCVYTTSLKLELQWIRWSQLRKTTLAFLSFPCEMLPKCPKALQQFSLKWARSHKSREIIQSCATSLQKVPEGDSDILSCFYLFKSGRKKISMDLHTQ